MVVGVQQSLFRQMDRDIPNYNPLVTNKIQQKQLHMHYQRLNSIKSSHYSRSGQYASQQKSNRKALQVQQEKKTQIQKHNVMLFNKMMRIMKRPDPCNQPGNSHYRNNNRTSAELSRIQEQNRTMYDRMEKQKPTIDHRKMQEDRKKNENILKFLGKYSAHSVQNMQQVSLRTSQATRTTHTRMAVPKSNHYLQQVEMNNVTQMRNQPRYSPYDVEQQVDEDEFKRHISMAKRGQRVYSSNHQTSSLTNKEDIMTHFETAKPNRVQITNTPQSAKDIILFKTKKEISGQMMEVSIVRSHNRYEIRGRVNQSTIKMVMSEQEGNQMLEINNYNYREIINRLVITHGVLSFRDSEEEEEEEIQPKEWTPYSDKPNAPSFNKPPIHYFNPSHISEQNDQESYRPAQTFNKKSPSKPQRFDSLGAEQQSGYLQQDPHQDSYPSVQPQQPEPLGQLQAIVESNGLQYSPDRQQDPLVPECQMGSYEQALQQQIL